MKFIQVKNSDGEWDVDFSISTEKWVEILKNKNIAEDKWLRYLRHLYDQVGHKGSCYDIGKKYNIHPSAYNTIIVAGAKRICKHLNLKFIGTNTQTTYWVLLMKGRYIQKGKLFEWELRHEIVQAIEYIDLENESYNLESAVDVLAENKGNFNEGKKIAYYTTKYERNIKNRLEAVRLHGTICEICGFDFEKVYGDIGKNFVEVHHKVPLSSIEQEVMIDPKNDLVCLCSNCHRMIHRKKNEILTVDELKAMIKEVPIHVK